MTPNGRLALLGLALLVLAPAIWSVASAMPPFWGRHLCLRRGVNAIVPEARHVSHMVAAANFDVRGFDTLGEECMLLCAVTGAVVLLCGSRGEGAGEKAGRVPGRPIIERSDATVTLCRLAALVVVRFGIYIPQRPIPFDSFHLIVKPTTTECGGIGPMPVPAAQFGASFLRAFGTTIIMPGRAETWIRLPGRD